MKRIWLRSVYSILFFLAFNSAATAAEVVDRVVGIVNGQIITLHDLNLKMQPLLFQTQGRTLDGQEQAVLDTVRKKILDEIVNSKLIEQEAQRLKMKVSDTEVENHIRQLKEANGLSDERMMEELRLQGLDEASFREKIRQDILRHQLLVYMVRRKVAITDEDIERYYQGHKKDFVSPSEVVFQLVLLPTQKDIQALAQAVKDGKQDFGEQAKKYSQGLEIDEAGNVGPVDLGVLDVTLRNKLESLSEQEISTPFPFAGNWAMLKLVRLVTQEPISRKDVREKIREILFKQLVDKRFDEFMKELRSKAVIEIML